MKQVKLEYVPKFEMNKKLAIECKTWNNTKLHHEIYLIKSNMTPNTRHWNLSDEDRLNTLQAEFERRR